MAVEKITAIEATYVMVPDHGSQTILRDKTVVVEGDRIKEVSDHYDGPVDLRIKADGRLLSPGFINCHTHVGCATYSRGMAEDRDLVEGSAFYHYFVPLLTIGYKHFTPDELSALLEWDILEMVKKGSTTILEESFGGYDHVIEIVTRLGNRAYVSYSYPNQVSKIGYLKDGKVCYDKPDPVEVGKGLRLGLEMYDKHNGSASDRIRVRLSPTGPDTCPPEVLRDTRKAADRLGCGISIHAAQHSMEADFCKSVFNASPIEHLANTGILGPDTLITHVTYTDEDVRCQRFGTVISQGQFGDVLQPCPPPGLQERPPVRATRSGGQRSCPRCRPSVCLSGHHASRVPGPLIASWPADPGAERVNGCRGRLPRGTGPAEAVSCRPGSCTGGAVRPGQ